jgi:hypothetical protein
MKQVLSIIFIGLLSLIVSGQTESEKPPTKIIFSPGLIYQGQFLGELNLMFSKLEIETGGSVIWGPRIGLETGYSQDKFLIAPKIGYEFSGLLICLRGNALVYIQDKKSDYRLLPEIGISLGGAMNLCYGYNFHIYNDKIENIGTNRISLTINLDLDLWKNL